VRIFFYTNCLFFLAAAVLTPKVSAEGGSVGRRVLASRHNQSLETPQVSLTFCFFCSPHTKFVSFF